MSEFMSVLNTSTGLSGILIDNSHQDSSSTISFTQARYSSASVWSYFILSRDKTYANKSSKKSMTQGTGGISNGEMMVRWLDSDEKIIDMLQGCGAAVEGTSSWILYKEVTIVPVLPLLNIACFVLRILKPYIKNFEYAKTQVMHQAMPAGGFLNYHPVYTRNMSYNLYQNGDTFCISGPYLRSLHIQGDRISKEIGLERKHSCDYKTATGLAIFLSSDR
ncbi:hypothetical protein D5086_024479 [Populus alba]|uniref:Uncharacterized protein n=1 Tax=Populus alba TaxID=43335 RepID=A0ACC4B691_POPAL